jgi:hypothetical protein
MMASVGTAVERIWSSQKSEAASLTHDFLGWLLPFGYFLMLGMIPTCGLATLALAAAAARLLRHVALCRRRLGDGIVAR